MSQEFAINESSRIPTGPPAEVGAEEQARRGLLGEIVHQGVGLVVSGESQTRTTAESMITQLATSVPLFVHGPAGYIGSGVLYALNGVRLGHGDSTGNILADMALGGIKGVATRGAFQYFGGQNLGIAMKGMTMGTSSRILDVGLTRQTYLDDKGKFSLTAGASMLAASTLSPKALLVDAVSGAAAGRVPFRSVALIGLATGVTSGALTEMQNELDHHEGLNLGKVLASAAEQGTVMSLASVAGHKLTPPGAADVIRMPRPGSEPPARIADVIAGRLEGLKSMLSMPDRLAPAVVTAATVGVRSSPMATAAVPTKAPAAGLRMENRAHSDHTATVETGTTSNVDATENIHDEPIEEPRIAVDPQQLKAAQDWFSLLDQHIEGYHDIRREYETDALPLKDAQHVATFARAETGEVDEFRRAFTFSERPQIEATIETVSDWAKKNPAAELTSKAYADLLQGDLHRALVWSRQLGDRDAAPLHALDFEHAKMLETLHGHWFDGAEDMPRFIARNSTRAGVEAAVVLDWLQTHRGEKLTQEQFDKLPFHNTAKLANLLDSLNTENGFARTRPQGPYPLTESEIELAKFAVKIDASGKSLSFMFSGLGPKSTELMHAFEHRGIEASRFAEYVMGYTAHRPELALSPEQLNEFMQDQRLQDGLLIDGLKRKDPSLIKRPEGDLAVTKDEIDRLTRLAQPRQYFNDNWAELMGQRGREATWLTREAHRYWSRNDYQALPEEELRGLGASQKAKALRLLDDIELDRNNARALPPGDAPVTLAEAKAMAALADDRNYGRSPRFVFFKRSLGAMKMSEEIANKLGRGTIVTQEWLDSIAKSDQMRVYRMHDALKQGIGDIRQVPTGEYPITLDEARLLERGGLDGHVTYAFGYRSAEAKRFAEILRGSRAERSWSDPPIEDISLDRYRRVGIAATEFEANAANLKTPYMPERSSWRSDDQNDTPHYDLRSIFAASEGLPDAKVVPYFRNWSRLVSSTYADEKGSWIKPETLRALTDILPPDGDYTGNQLKGLYDRIEREGSVLSVPPEQLRAAIRAWANQPALPDSLAVEVGSMPLQQRLASGLAWQSALNDVGIDLSARLSSEQMAAIEPYFRNHMSQLSQMKRRDLLRALTDPRSIPDAVELQFGDTLSAQDRVTLANSLMKSATENIDPAMAANQRHAMAVPEPYAVLPSLSAKSFADALRATEMHGGADPRAAIAGALTFKGSFPQWLSMQKGFGRSLHDATYWLPTRPAHEQAGLGEALINNGAKRLVDLEMTAREWPNLDQATRDRIKKPPGIDKETGKKIDELGAFLQDIRSRTYPGHKSAEFANEAAIWGVSPEEYESFEKRFLDSQKAAMPFPTEARFKAGNLIGRFIPRSDARGIFLGQYTNCCQHPWGQASSSAWYGQESPHSGFFVVENPRGDVVAMSWVWQSAKGGLVFDNVEAKGINSREKQVQDIYENAARALAPKFGVVTLGTKLGDLHTDRWPDTTPLPLPADYSGYSDAPSQVLLAEHHV